MDYDKLRRRATFPLVLLIAGFVLWEQRYPDFDLARWGAVAAAVLLLLLQFAAKLASRRR